MLANAKQGAQAGAARSRQREPRTHKGHASQVQAAAGRAGVDFITATMLSQCKPQSSPGGQAHKDTSSKHVGSCRCHLATFHKPMPECYWPCVSLSLNPVASSIAPLITSCLRPQFAASSCPLEGSCYVLRPAGCNILHPYTHITPCPRPRCQPPPACCPAAPHAWAAASQAQPAHQTQSCLVCHA